MNKLTSRLALLGLIVIGLVHLSSFAVASADAGASGGPTLEEAQVFPENGPWGSWGSIFTYEVIYTDNENNMPVAGYPKVYIDGSPENMVEEDPTDDDVTDGKVYKYDWATAKENVGPHSFYCYVETPTGENAVTGTDNGPLVEKWPVSLSCKVDKPEPATGETVVFSGYLSTTEENLAGESIILYKLLSDNEVSVSSSTTQENGYFTLLLDAPSSGIFCYRARFPGDNYYEVSESSRLYVNTLNKPLVFGVYVVILFALVGAMMFMFSRGIARAHYLKPVLLGFVLGFLLLIIGAGFIGVLAAGAIAGYLFAKEARRWTKHLRIGCMAGFLFLLVGGLIFAYFLTWSPADVGLNYSVTQMEIFGFFFSDIIFSLVNYALLVGMGAVLGGMLRKLLKPAEQRPTGSGETTSSGVEQR
ncbi:hypothetical protein ES706_02844 [subsurface metagenome]|nr:MAG: hypothetical protein CEE41_02250 [Hadesarchaea archaeon B3_Hades]